MLYDGGCSGIRTVSRDWRRQSTVRTLPGHSWKNLVKRIISILNLGLQCIGFMRQEMDKELEEIMSKCNNMNDIRKAAEKASKLKNELKESLNPTITLLNDLFKRLQLKDKNFETFKAASEFDMNVLWDLILRIDSTLMKEDKN
ncbi:hypothetical protein RclHR1_02450002 [Rhizophagus clarus]|uniref:Uncharacterized protein n=2 Tax=Rhizophagus clarus TaxID=94130 RepID=A0A2Z6RBB6_9GLOM|nr:hypothetical protein RclHR1_02450002 [Rhizophagus clarus]